MKIIPASYGLIEEPTLTKKIERIARICYKSEEKIGEGTDVKMIQNLLDRNHMAMLEHGDVCMEVSGSVFDLITTVVELIETAADMRDFADARPDKMFIRRTATLMPDDTTMRYLVSGNFRAWFEFFLHASAYGAVVTEMYHIVNDQIAHLFDTTQLADMDLELDYEEWEDVEGIKEDGAVWATLVTDFDGFAVCERMVHETFSVLFTVDRGITHELVRMRDCSFAQESTRYCNYSLNKYGREITVIEPCFFAKAGCTLDTDTWAECYGAWEAACHEAERSYFRLLDAKATPQQARDVLPTSVKSEIVMTTNLREWFHIFALRACEVTGPVHPQMAEVMIPLFKEMREKYAFAFDTLLTVAEVKALEQKEEVQE